MPVFTIFFLFLLSIALVLFLIYLPALHWKSKSKRLKATFLEQLDTLALFFQQNVFVITKPLGEGGSHNSGVTFEDAHKNQSFAMNTILSLLDEEATKK